MNSFVYVWAAAKTTISQHTTTTTGSLSGVIVDGVATYRGVPYARPPLGDLRWRPPVPVTPWSGVRAADKDGPGCPQECLLPALTCPPITSEDCLYLNVFAPANATVTSSGSAAVLLFIHGGNFIQGYGGGPLYDGSMLVQSHGVVVVSINYRLGALGWLFTGAPPSEEPTDDLVGNYGLLDQQLAMRWVQANAARFGGDPSRITLFGQSAGAQSISCHLTMPSSKGLFAGAILESAPLGLTWRTAEQSPKFTGLVAKLGGCIGTTPGEYVPCLRAMPVDTLLKAQTAAGNNIPIEAGTTLSLFEPFAPTVATALLTQQPLNAFLAGRVHDVPILLGSVEQEGLVFVYEAFPTPVTPLEMDSLLRLVWGADAPAIRDAYPVPAAQQAAHDARNATSLVATDGLFHCAIRAAGLALADQYAKGRRTHPTYVYNFDHLISFGASFWLPTNPVCVEAVCHGEELPFVFQPDVSIINVSFTSEEVVLSDLMQTHWAAFASTGHAAASVASVASKPAPQAVTQAAALDWPLFEPANESYALFRAPDSHIVPHPFRAKCAVWDSIGWDWIVD